MSTVISPVIAAMLAKSSIVKTDEMDVGGGGVARISLNKSKFTAKSGDEELKLGEVIDVVIVGITPGNGFVKTYYAKGFTPGSIDAPDCQSSDGIRPDVYVDNPLSDLCGVCEKNQWGSATSMAGKKAKACKDSKRLHVILAEDLGKPEAITYILTVTVMSLKPFGDYGKLLAREGIPTPAIVITRLGFDDEASVPKLTFENLGLLDDDNCQLAIEVADKKEWESPFVAGSVSTKKLDNKTEQIPLDVYESDSSESMDDAVSKW